MVIGDMMLDRFIWGRVRRISPEAPVPVVEVERESCQPGGASNVVNNIGALGARTCMVGVVGSDADGQILRDELSRAGVEVSGIAIDSDRPTAVKTRVVAHSQQVVRVDREARGPLSERTHQKIESSAAKESPFVDAVVFSDYSKGVLSRRLVEVVCESTLHRGVPVLGNAKPGNLDLFRGITMVSLNLSEAEAAVGFEIDGEASLSRAGLALLRRVETRYALITLGARGLALFTSGLEAPFRVPAINVPVYDVSGAGDTVISTLALALSAGSDARTAANLASMAAGTVVRKFGVATASRDEIVALYRELAEGLVTYHPQELG